jgi:hypothetical protein
MMMVPGSRPRHARMKVDCPMVARGSVAPASEAARPSRAVASAAR